MYISFETIVGIVSLKKAVTSANLTPTSEQLVTSVAPPEPIIDKAEAMPQAVGKVAKTEIKSLASQL